jgi:hypothetical protein
MSSQLSTSSLSKFTVFDSKTHLNLEYQTLLNNSPCIVFFKYSNTLNFDESLVLADKFAVQFPQFSRPILRIVKNSILRTSINSLYDSNVSLSLNSLFKGKSLMLILNDYRLLPFISVLMASDVNLVLLGAIFNSENNNKRNTSLANTIDLNKLQKNVNDIQNLSLKDIKLTLYTSITPFLILINNIIQNHNIKMTQLLKGPCVPLQLPIKQ